MKFVSTRAGRAGILAAGALVLSMLIPAQAGVVHQLRDHHLIRAAFHLNGDARELRGIAVGPFLAGYHFHEWGNGAIIALEDCQYAISPDTANLHWNLTDEKGNSLFGDITYVVGPYYTVLAMDWAMTITGGTGVFAGWRGTGGLEARPTDPSCGWEFVGDFAFRRTN